MLSHAHPQPILVVDAQLACKKVMWDADSYKDFLLLHLVRSSVHTHDKHAVRNRKSTLRGLHESLLITQHHSEPC